MSSIKFKNKKMIYVTDEDQARIKKRAKELGMSQSTYLTELAMWEARYKLLPRIRDGSILSP